MGKGNAKSFIGKLFHKSYGKYRPRKRKKNRKHYSIDNHQENAKEIIPKYDIATEFYDLPSLKKGDILWAHDRINHYHPIIFIKEKENDFFDAGILSTKLPGINIKMSPRYFCDEDEHGNPYTLPRNKNNQYLVIKRYEKKNDWVFGKKPEGRLTEEGIRFVESQIPPEATYHPKPVWEQ
jgi:ribosomal small subunit protein bTHX